MVHNLKPASFGSLFRKFRLKAEIESLREFGDLLAEEGYIYETSIFTRWQKDERTPKDRKLLLTILKIFARGGGIAGIDEANMLVEGAGQRGLDLGEFIPLSIPLDVSLEPNLRTALGSLLRSFRLEKRITYSEISLAMGWRNMSMFEYIESGKLIKPERGDIDKLCKVLCLNTIEKNKILYVGGYLPTNKEILAIRRRTKNTLEAWQYPAVLIDYSWRIIAENSKSKMLYNYSNEILDRITRETPSIIELQFDKEMSVYSKLNQTEQRRFRKDLIQMLIQFQLVNHLHRGEYWYKNLISKMKKNNLFAEMWKKSLDTTTDKIIKEGTKFFPTKDSDFRLKLRFILVPLIEDPRFEIEFHFPIDDSSSNYFRSHFEK